MDTPRNQFTMSSTNNSKKSLVYLSIFSIPHVEKIEIQNNNLLQTNQVDLYKAQDTILFYATHLFYTTPKE